MIDETASKPGPDVSRRSSLSSIHPPPTIKEEENVMLESTDRTQQGVPVEAVEGVAVSGHSSGGPSQQDGRKTVLHK